MQPHANFGIRQRRAKCKGFWWDHKANKAKMPEEVKPEQQDEGVVAGVSEIWKRLLRGKGKKNENLSNNKPPHQEVGRHGD